MENPDQFVERGVEAVKAELGKQPFRGSPHFDDLLAVARAVLRIVADGAPDLAVPAVPPAPPATPAAVT